MIVLKFENALIDYKRNLSNLRAIMNFVSKELGLEPSLAFSGVYLGEDVGTVKASRSQ